MSAPSGLLIWGQGGTYDAIYDRAAITVLANGAKGVVQPTVLSAGSGLTVNVAAWRAVVDCGDGSLAIIGSVLPTAVTVPAGGATVRTDVLWADIDPIDGTWTLNLRSTTDIVGRLGVELARITVPVNANAASAFTYAVTGRTWNPYPVPTIPRAAAGQTTLRFNKASYASVRVNFPAGRFTAAPACIPVAAHSSFFLSIAAASATGFTIYGRVYNDTKPTINITVHWIAREMG